MNWIKKTFKKFIYQESSPKKLALSFSVGTYIAFSPFVGLHTAMVFFFSWLWRLNLGLTFASSCFIHNPWTMIPVYGLDYIFGYWLLKKVLGFKFALLNPWWMVYINDFCEKNLGVAKPCLWSFLIGGNILAIGLALIMYPIMKKFFSHYLILEHRAAYENNYSK